MLRGLFAFLGRLYQLVASLVLIAIMGVAAWYLWHTYEDERLQNRFLQDGQVVEVSVAQADHAQRSWRDVFGNAVYISFPYHQKTYETRYVMDSGWVSSGQRVRLLYHPARDEFRQQHYERKPNRWTSRLIKWSVVGDFSTEYKLLGGFLVIVTFLFFLTGGLIVSLTGWTFIQTIARLALLAVLLPVAVFFTYDAIKYFDYYNHIKSNGKPLEVTVLGTEQHLIGRSTQSTGLKSYYYEATGRYQNKERVFPITEDEYEVLKPNDSLRVLYDSSLDDLMSATYTASYGQIVAPLFFWGLLLVIFWNTFVKKETQKPY